MTTHNDPTRSARMRGYLSITPATTPLGILAWVWRQVPVEELLHFVADHLTPDERRLLQECLDVAQTDEADEEEEATPNTATVHFQPWRAEPLDEHLEEGEDETPDTATFRYSLGEEVRWAEAPRTPYVIVQRRWTQQDVFAPLVEYLCTPR